ncbi:MAG: molybdopterin molybdenumtransferase MoeA, partial [Nitrososphaeria archaeon]|nr:molybdopterin molybdenumtransferase MoeA [Nitrososphaeria archaeon]
MPFEYKLKAKPYEVALRDSLEAFTSTPLHEMVPVTEALGRRLAVDVTAPYDMPKKNIAFYDGYAVRYEDTRGATASNPVRLKLIGSVLKEGDEHGLRIEKGMAVYLSANSPLPEGANAVVREELTSREGDMVVIKKEIEIFEDTVLQGEDAKKGEILM